MSIGFIANASAVGYGITVPMYVTGTPTAPVSYSVSPGGPGGTVSVVSGAPIYTAPYANGVDVIQAVDATGKLASFKMRVGTPIHLFCDIIQTGMGLDDGRVYLWDQKINAPTDSGIFIAVSVMSEKFIGAGNRFDPTLNQEVQSINVSSVIGIDLISRGPDARDRRDELIMSLSGNYAERQQELNSFKVSRLSNSFTNLSLLEGAAIPYRFHTEVQLQYFVTKKISTDYFDTFQTVQVVTND